MRRRCGRDGSLSQWSFRLSLDGNETSADGSSHGIRPVRGPELSANGRHMKLHRLVADTEAPRDRLVRQTLKQVAEYFDFAKYWLRKRTTVVRLCRQHRASAWPDARAAPTVGNSPTISRRRVIDRADRVHQRADENHPHLPIRTLADGDGCREVTRSAKDPSAARVRRGRLRADPADPPVN